MELIPEETEKSVQREMVSSRQISEIQSAMIIAKRFPRDEMQALGKILKSCRRPGLAEQAEYEYPRGGTKVTGPSIRLAESIAQNWGNVDFGMIELDNSRGQSQIMAYAWDLETNTRVTKVFSVKHVRDTRQGSKDLTEGRDIYEATANFGSRRVRACILGIIPGDVVEAAVNECRKTIAGQNKTPIEDRIAKLLDQFNTELRVTQEQIEEYLGCNAKSITEKGLLRMANVLRSIRDGMSVTEDYFKGKDAPAATPGFVDPFKGGEARKATKEAKKEEPKKDPDDELREKLRAENPAASEFDLDDLLEAFKSKKSKQ